MDSYPEEVGKVNRYGSEPTLETMVVKCKFSDGFTKRVIEDLGYCMERVG